MQFVINSKWMQEGELKVGQLSYTLEQKDEVREEQFLDCIRSCMERRSMCLEQDTWEVYKKNKDAIVESFQEVLGMAIQQIGEMIASGSKQPVSYIQLSYLLSGALLGEHLLKVDFYDYHYYGDMQEIDCFWDYGALFPQYEQELRFLEKELRQALPRISAYELQKAQTYYQVGNFMVLETILQDMMQKIKPEERLGGSSAVNGAVFYGAYLDQSEMIYRWGRE